MYQLKIVAVEVLITERIGAGPDYVWVSCLDFDYPTALHKRHLTQCHVGHLQLITCSVLTEYSFECWKQVWADNDALWHRKNIGISVLKVHGRKGQWFVQATDGRQAWVPKGYSIARFTSMIRTEFDCFAGEFAKEFELVEVTITKESRASVRVQARRKDIEPTGDESLALVVLPKSTLQWVGGQVFASRGSLQKAMRGMAISKAA